MFQTKQVLSSIFSWIPPCRNSHLFRSCFYCRDKEVKQTPNQKTLSHFLCIISLDPGQDFCLKSLWKKHLTTPVSASANLKIGLQQLYYKCLRERKSLLLPYILSVAPITSARWRLCQYFQLPMSSVYELVCLYWVTAMQSILLGVSPIK